MAELSLDDQLKKAQIEKTAAEAAKLSREAESLKNPGWGHFWSETVKILGGVILGIGGVVVAYTQYEVGELKAKAAKDELARAVGARSDAEAATRAAEARRDAAIREQKDAEAAVAELKKSLAQTSSALTAAAPGQVKSRLAYIQFRGEMSREVINELRAALSKKLFNAPGAERVAGEYQNLVKYFRPGENADADELSAAVEAFFAARGCPVKMRVVPATTSTVQSPPLEVWLAHKCPG
jgi:hypothetical protein